MILGPIDEAGMDPEGYPWYGIVQGTELAQGDLLEGCPIFLPPADLAEPWEGAAFAWQQRDVVVLNDGSAPRPASRGGVRGAIAAMR
jgi:hypothetical protein